jgi:predicted metal-dependent RNase
MLAELTLLLHELFEPADNRGRPTGDASPRLGVAGEPVAVVVTGLPSPGKTRLVEALRERLRVDGIAVEASGGTDDHRPVVRVHAETDLEALIEGAPVVTRSARGADVIVPVDWEAPSRSVARIVELLIARGLVAPEV